MWKTATEFSDWDFRAVVRSPLSAILDPFQEIKPAAQVKSNGHDVSTYELQHFARLASRGNPTLMEILFTPYHDEYHPIGLRLREERHIFVGTEEVYRSHTGFAKGQLIEAKKDQPARPRGKLLSSAILGLLQAHELIQEGDVDLSTLLREGSSYQWERPSYHISLKTSDEHHADAAENIEMLIASLEWERNNNERREPDYDAIRALVFDAYTQK